MSKEPSADLLTTIQKHLFERSTSSHPHSYLSYFATFASNFSRIFSILGFAWKVQ